MLISAVASWPVVGDIVDAKTSANVFYQRATVRQVSFDSVTVQWNSNGLCDTIDRSCGMIQAVECGEEAEWSRKWPPITTVPEHLITDESEDPTTEMPDIATTTLNGLPIECADINSGRQLRIDVNDRSLEATLRPELSHDKSLVADVTVPVNTVISNDPVDHNLHSTSQTTNCSVQRSRNTCKSTESIAPVLSLEDLETMLSNHTKDRLKVGLNEEGIRDQNIQGPLRHLELFRFVNFGQVFNINSRLAVASPNTKVRTLNCTLLHSTVSSGLTCNVSSSCSCSFSHLFAPYNC
jgi:hypothetical protein